MKKILAFILSLLMLLCSASAMAEEIDISSMSLDELVELQGKIASRINELLGTSSDAMYLGEYVCGIDIKSGRYLLTALERESPFMIKLYADASMEDAGDSLVHESIYGGETYDLEIEDGMILVVYRGGAIVTPRTKPSWAP